MVPSDAKKAESAGFVRAAEHRRVRRPMKDSTLLVME